jgi:proteasome lid subunit RPN8/RPN11
MLKISQTHFDALRRHGEETYPHECCGVLVGRSLDGQRQVHEVIRCGNTRTDSPQNRYNIDARELVRILRQAQERGMEIIGFYHSHPDHPARWSKTDMEEAHWFGCSYVITRVANGTAAETNSFLLLGENEEHKRFEDEELTVVSS